MLGIGKDPTYENIFPGLKEDRKSCHMFSEKAPHRVANK
jgi:hypothetical protein